MSVSISKQTKQMSLVEILKTTPQAEARVYGSAQFPKLNGIVRFYQTMRGVLVLAEVAGLPDGTGRCENPVFGFHIHAGTSCTGTEAEPFADTLTHYNIGECPHPYHAGDLPPLFDNHGYAFMMVLSDRFTVEEIIGRTIVIHSAPDDFTTQPAGNAGSKIACGVIQKIENRR